MFATGTLGRFAEPAMRILVSLHEGPREIALLLDMVQMHDRPMRPGTLFAAVARLERLALIEPATGATGRPAYRLTQVGQVAARGVLALRREATR